MKKSLMLFLSGVGLVLVVAAPAFAQMDNLPLPSLTTTCIIGASTRPGKPNGQAALPDSSVGSAPATPAASNNTYDGSATANHNAGNAALAGMITLLLFQRRYRTRNILTSKS